MENIRKVFGIGEPKTGTATLGVCLRSLNLGERCASWRPELALFWDGGELDFDRILEASKKYTCFHDFPWNYMDFYQRFDEAYPGSKFILTIRDSEKWFDSFRRWGTRPGGREDILWRLYKQRSRGPLSDPKVRKEVIKSFEGITKLQYGIDEVGPISRFKDNFIEAYEERNASIARYFKDRPDDLLIVDWEDGHGWEELCGFLDLPIPSEQFPHINKRK